MKSRHTDLVAALTCVAVAVIVIQLFPEQLLLRVGLVLPVVFFLPGYLMLCALAPQRRWELAEMGVTSIGLSLALGVIGGLLLNSLQLGLTTTTWLIFYTLICIINAVIAFIRRLYLLPAEYPTTSLRWRFSVLLPVLVAIVLVAGAWIVGSIAQLIQHQDNFTQLWVVPCQTDTCDIEFGIYSYEFQSHEYRLVLRAGNRLIQTFTVTIEHNQTWTTTLYLPDDYPRGVDLHLDLYLAGNSATSPYRYVLLRYTALKE